VSASIIVLSPSKMAQTLFGFGLAITASMIESLLAAADDSNKAPNSNERRTKDHPKTHPEKDRLLGVGGWLRRELARTFVAVCCERALLAKSVASALSGSARPHRD
jgi:hypothetical protein